MRFEVISTFVVGAVLPIFETVSRDVSYWTVNITGLFDDYLAGGLLLVAGCLGMRAKPSAPIFLVAGWALVTGVMSSNYWQQIESRIRGLDVEPENGVLALKILLWGTSVISLVLSFHRAAAQIRRHHDE